MLTSSPIYFPTYLLTYLPTYLWLTPSNYLRLWLTTSNFLRLWLTTPTTHMSAHMQDMDILHTCTVWTPPHPPAHPTLHTHMGLPPHTQIR